MDIVVCLLEGGEEEVLAGFISRCCFGLDCGIMDSGDGYKNNNNNDDDRVEEFSMERRSLYDPATVARCEEALEIRNYFHTSYPWRLYNSSDLLMEQKRERGDNGGRVAFIERLLEKS